MKLFAIADLHLSGHSPKPMEVFGRQWEGHWDLIRTAWREAVTEGDAVLLPGDLSWAMTLEQAKIDITEIAELPGDKLLLRGNHDYWWSSAGRVRQAMPRGMRIIQNDAARVGQAVVCGSRGWTCPGSSAWEGSDEKIYLREIIRLRMSLDTARALAAPGAKLVAMLHFPPFNERREPSGFTALFEEYSVDTAVYGHLHGVQAGAAFEGDLNGVRYQMVSCDYLGFRPKLIMEL